MKIKRSKRYRANQEKREPQKRYSYKEAIDKLLEMAPAKYDETVDAAFRLGVDPKQSDQQVRGAVVLPNGTGKKIKILVFAKGEKEKEAQDSGADYIGANDLVEKIEKGWMDFDKVIATPDMMGTISKLGKVLGPRGLMPNPKLGTVTFDVGDAVKNERKGKVEYRVDKTGIIHSMIGKVSFGKEKLQQNFKALADALWKQKPSGAKGVYFRSVTVSSTHGPGVKIDSQGLVAGAEEV